MKIIVIPVHGPVRAETIGTELAEYQRLVGGYIEHFAGELGGTEFSLWLNEEGKLLGLEHNVRATALVIDRLFDGDYIAGDVFLSGDGEYEDVPTSIAEACLAVLG